MRLTTTIEVERDGRFIELHVEGDAIDVAGETLVTGIRITRQSGLGLHVAEQERTAAHDALVDAWERTAPERQLAELQAAIADAAVAEDLAEKTTSSLYLERARAARRAAVRAYGEAYEQITKGNTPKGDGRAA